MKKIGIVTFFKNYNYGSILQCYALQHVLKEYNVYPIALKQKENGLKWKLKKLVRTIVLFISILRYPSRGIELYKSNKESKRSCKDMSQNAIKKIDDFIEDNIVYEVKSFDSLMKDNEICGYISGSDQVWGTSSYFLNPFMFLRFTDKSKRYSYAASLGSDVCPKWYRRLLRKYLSDYKKISVREESGLAMMNEFGIKANIHVDPTLLLDKNQWMERMINVELEEYIFLYFLNKPSSIAIEHINMLIETDKVKEIRIAPYIFKEFSEIKGNIKFVDLSPDEFLGMISGAKTICTDSFHGAVFSIIFRKIFYSYYRQYSHGVTQNNRIDTLLKHYSLQKQMVTDNKNKNVPLYDDISTIICKDRERACRYLAEIVGEII